MLTLNRIILIFPQNGFATSAQSVKSDCFIVVQHQTITLLLKFFHNDHTPGERHFTYMLQHRTRNVFFFSCFLDFDFDLKEKKHSKNKTKTKQNKRKKKRKKKKKTQKPTEITTGCFYIEIIIRHFFISYPISA